MLDYLEVDMYVLPFIRDFTSIILVILITLILVVLIHDYIEENVNSMKKYTKFFKTSIRHRAYNKHK